MSLSSPSTLVEPPPVVESKPGHSVSIRGRRYPVLLPRLGDPRLHVAAVIVSVQILGQTVLGFDVSVAQILISIGVAGVLELGIVAATRGVIAWPASALLTGNGVALLLRTPGTVHGDWWSTRGWPIFVAASGISLLSKYAIRVGDRHLFNPSNFGLVVVFLVFGSQRADPQDLWWGPWSLQLAVTLAVIVFGGLTLSVRLHLFSVAATFWVTFSLAIGALAASGHEITARWHIGPVSGWTFWSVFVVSPEIMIFLFFMITDPRTAPVGRVARPVYAAAVGVLAGVLVGLQTTEFASKVSLLVALTLVCAARPLLERWLPDHRFAGSGGRLWRPASDSAAVTQAVGPRLRPTRTGALVAVATMVVSLGAVLVAGAVSGDLPDARLTSVGTTAVGERPVVDLPPGALPPVLIDESLDAIAGAVSAAEARRIGHDLIENLAIEGEAIGTGDPALAATAAFGPRLVELRAEIAAAQRADRVVVPGYEVDRMLLVLLRDPANPQSVPQFGVMVAGRVTQVTRAGSDGRVLDQTVLPLEATYLVSLLGDHYLVGAELPPGHPMIAGDATLPPG